MKHITVSVAVAAMGFAGVSAGFEAPPTGDPIKDGQTFRSTVATAALGTDPIKDGQTIMALTGNDLGSSAPARANWSQSPNWQAFAYERQGVRYIQVNDLEGVVHVVVGITRARTLVLPLGTDADQVVVGLPTVHGATVYRDAAVEVELVGTQWFVHAPRQ